MKLIDWFRQFPAWVKSLLVEDWREAFTWISMWCFGAIVTIQTNVLVLISKEQLESAVLFFPSMTWGGLSDSVIATLALVGGVGRMLAQKKPEKPAPQSNLPV